MAHYEDQATAIESGLELLSEHGLGQMAEAMQTLLNEAMKLERKEFLRAAPVIESVLRRETPRALRSPAQRASTAAVCRLRNGLR